MTVTSDQNDLILKPLNLTYSLVKELFRLHSAPGTIVSYWALCFDETPAERG